MIVDKSYIDQNKEKVIEAIKSGKIFIYPTDTIYGIGCNALNKEAVAKIRKLKNRETKPFSIIVPDLNWIKENCETNSKIDEYLGKLPGAYTFFLKLKDKSILPEEVNPSGDGTIGVRIPDHWFSNLISKADLPFITTSVNLSGKPHMTDLKDLDETIMADVDYIVYEGPNNGKESTKVDLTK